MNSFLLRTSDWLRHSPEAIASSDSNREAQLGALAVLAAGLESGESFEHPIHCMTVLRPAMRLLPPQFAGLPMVSPLGEWLNVVALAELAQAPQLADLMLVELIARLAPTMTGTLHGYLPRERKEVAAVCWARRGRVARTQGRLDDAEAYYLEAIRIAGRTWRDARPQALIGLALLAANRGNLPEAEELALRVLARRPQVFALYRVQAHQLATFTMRRRGCLLDALLHGWRAFDLIDTDDSRRDELLVTMAEIAMTYGDLDSAARGFSSVRHGILPLRVRVPALVGALDVTVRRLESSVDARSVGEGADGRPGHRRAVLAARQALLALLDEPLSPSDRLLAEISLGEAAIALNERSEAATWITRAAQNADQHGFHEKRFHVDSLRAQLDAGTVHAAPPAKRVITKTPLALRRFSQLDEAPILVGV